MRETSVLENMTTKTLSREDALVQTERILRQLMRSGVSEAELIRQFLTFKRGLPFITLDRACTVGDGIERIQPNDESRLLSLCTKAIAAGRVMKFVPASGAATRMFKSLITLNERPELTIATLQLGANEGNADDIFGVKFFQNIYQFAFFSSLQHVMQANGYDIYVFLAEGKYAKILEYLLTERGLNYAHLPKGLIEFHSYSDATGNFTRTPIEEHLVEALEYTKDTQQSTQHGGAIARVHFTISPEHREAVEYHIATVRGRNEAATATLDIRFSQQKQSTDTVAVTSENEPFLSDDGLHFRPAGHGALLENLNDLQADIVFIKNIDNVVPDRIKSETYRFKRLLCGYLVELQNAVFKYLWVLESGSVSENVLQEILDFARWRLYIELHKTVEEYTPQELQDFLFVKLNRPLRVCGMVKNEGEPGGGPFFVRESDGTTSLQIVETAQIDRNKSEQNRILEQSTHFNPVDLVCGVRNYKGIPFNLLHYRNQNTGFISVKSKDGQELKALELPGLWNGSMAEWNTVFVEVPSSTFHPVKTVNDLLRTEHQTDKHTPFLSFYSEIIMNLETTVSGKVCIVKVQDKRLDAKVAIQFKEKMSELINADNWFLVLDLSNVDFIDSSGLGAIVTSLKILGRRGDLVIAGVKSDVMMMFSLTRMDRVFRIFPTATEAVTALT